jgi:hypothetical protein
MSDEKNTPIWKKEISFGKKAKKAKEADADGVSGADAELAAAPEAPLEGAPTIDLDLIA